MTPFGPYLLMRRLGAGATAEVFLAQGPNPRGEELLALKLLLPHLAGDGGHQAMLLREARAVAPLRHPHIAELYDVGESGGRTYLAMEYVPGFPLNALIRALRERNERLPVAEAAHVVRGAALGLHHAHQALDPDGQPLGLIHRDVSPHNLMVRGDGQLKVVDFGLARATGAGATQTGGLKGKLRYMPPEQLRSERLDRRVDVFALGAILWELLLGTPLYPGPTEAEIFQQALFLPQPHPDELVQRLPRALVELLRQAVERDAQRRIASAGALAKDLEPFVAPGAAEALAQRMARLLGRAPRTAAEVADAPAPDLAQPQTGSHSTLSGSLAPAGAQAPAPPPAPLHTPQEARLAPALAPLPRVARSTRPGRTQLEAAARPAAAKRKRGPPPEAEPPVTSTRVRRWRARQYLAWGAICAVAAVSAGATWWLIQARQAAANEAGEEVRAALPSGPALPEPVVKAPVVKAPVVKAPAAAELARSEPALAGRPVAAERPARRGRGTLILTSDAPALVRQGARELGMTPLTVELAAGRQRISLRSVDGARGATVVVAIPKDGVVSRQVVLEPL